MSTNVLDWSTTAAVGDCLVYHQGCESPPREVSQLANAASSGGLVFLAQRRAPGGFVYEATRISEAAARALGLVRRPRATS